MGGVDKSDKFVVDCNYRRAVDTDLFCFSCPTGCTASLVFYLHNWT